MYEAGFQVLRDSLKAVPRVFQPSQHPLKKPGGISFERVAVDTQKNIAGGKGDTLVAVDKGRVDKQAFKQGCRFFDNIRIISALGEGSKAWL